MSIKEGFIVDQIDKVLFFIFLTILLRKVIPFPALVDKNKPVCFIFMFTIYCLLCLIQYIRIKMILKVFVVDNVKK